EVFDREQFFRRSRTGEVDDARRRAAGRRRDRNREDAGPVHRLRPWLLCAADIAAAPDFAFDQTGTFKEFVCGGNGGAVQSKLASQFACWWESLAHTQAAGFNQLLQVCAQLAVNRSG